MTTLQKTLIAAVACGIFGNQAFAQKAPQQLALLQPSNAGPFDEFAYSASISDDVVATTGCGGVCLFVKPTNGWKSTTQSAALTASDGSILVVSAISGNTVAAAGSNGELYVFVEPQSGWANTTETAKLTTSDGSHLNSVAISGNTIISGSPTATVGGRQSQGAVYIFVEPTGGWIDAAQDAILTASDGQAGDNFGNAVVIEGTTALVGAYNASTGGFGVQGAAYLFTMPAQGWSNSTETAKFTASDGTSDAAFGRSVSLDGQTAVVGASTALDANDVGGGAVYVFAEPPSGWATGNETAKLTPTNPVELGSLGYSVCVSGNLISAGAPGAFGFTKRQATYEFLKPASGWQNKSQSAAITPKKAPGYAQFGYATGCSGNTIVVGSPGSEYTSYEGAAYVFAP